MIRNTCLTMAFILFGLFSFAQSDYTETIILKNGSEVIGRIIEFVPNKTYTVKTKEGGKIVCDIEDIVKITKTFQVNENMRQNSQNGDLFAKGYHFGIETGVGAGMGTYGLDVFKLDLVNTFRLNDNLSVGGTIGVRAPLPNDNFLFIPIMANASYNLNKEKISPYGNLSAGVSFNNVDGFNEGGVIVNPALGVQFNSFDKFLLHTTIGYDVMQMKFLQIVGWPTPYAVTRIRFAESLAFNVGITF